MFEKKWRVPDSWKPAGKISTEVLIELPSDDKDGISKPLVLKWQEFLENDGYRELTRYAASFYYDNQPIITDYTAETRWATYRLNDKRPIQKVEYEGLEEFPGDALMLEAIFKNKKDALKDAKYDRKTERWELNFSAIYSGEVYNTYVWCDISVSLSLDLKNLKGRYFESSYIDDLS